MVQHSVALFVRRPMNHYNIIVVIVAVAIAVVW